MVSITKKTVTKSLTSDMRRATKRLYEQICKALLTEENAMRRQARLEMPKKKRKYTVDMEMVDKLDAGFRGEISYKIFGNKQLRIDRPKELTREHGIFEKTKKVLKRNAETGAVYLSLHEKKSWARVTSHQYAEDGTLRTKHVKYRDGRFEEKWERDETGSLVRTRYVNRGRLSGRLFRPVSEELSAPEPGGPENRLYRKLTRQVGSRRETFERDDKGGLELVGYKRPGFSRNTTKSEDRHTSQTKIRKLGGTFSKSYRSLLDKEGNEVGRDILSHRRMFNKRSAIYDESTKQLTSIKHTFGKIYKSESQYLSAEIKKVSKKILGVTVRRKLTALSEPELCAQRLRVSESVEHRKAWQEPTAITRSSPREDPSIPLVSKPDRTDRVRNGRGVQTEAKLTLVNDKPVDLASQNSPLFLQQASEQQFGLQPQSPSSAVHFSDSASKAEGVTLGKGPISQSPRRGNEREVRSEENLDKYLGHSVSSNESLSEITLHGSPQKPTLTGLRETPPHSSLDLQSSDAINDAQAPQVTSSAVSHQSAPEQELLSFLNGVPAPVHSGGERIAEHNRDVAASNAAFDPQSLFGEPDLSRASELRLEFPAQGDRLSDAEQQALLNGLLAIPLPARSAKMNSERSMILEGSRSRERPVSGGLSL
ncbi:UNVERIFIED_ORG: hypothetical protein GGI57_006362 [Rhizobium aethiopicum]